jgi:hypothetical protein
MFPGAKRPLFGGLASTGAAGGVASLTVNVQTSDQGPRLPARSSARTRHQ